MAWQSALNSVPTNRTGQLSNKDPANVAKQNDANAFAAHQGYTDSKGNGDVNAKIKDWEFEQSTDPADIEKKRLQREQRTLLGDQGL